MVVALDVELRTSGASGRSGGGGLGDRTGSQCEAGAEEPVRWRRRREEDPAAGAGAGARRRRRRCGVVGQPSQRALERGPGERWCGRKRVTVRPAFCGSVWSPQRGNLFCSLTGAGSPEEADGRVLQVSLFQA